MKTAGIIAEYNPFHNGHAYQLKEVRRRTGADRIVVAMSGDFVQRGTPAILDKYTRARMVLESGADLVLELPFLYAAGPAELFAFGGVSLLAASGLIDVLCFGAESDQLSALKEVSSILKEEPAGFSDTLKQGLKQGLSFPAARQAALFQSLEAARDTISKDSLSSDLLSRDLLHELLSSPNNILAIEYLKNLPSDVEVCLIPRKGSDYHSSSLTDSYASATAIRSLLQKGIPHPGQNARGLADYVPASSLFAIMDARKEGRLLYEDCLSAPLACRLTLLKHEFVRALDITDDRSRPKEQFADCSPELLQRILKLSDQFRDYESFCLMVKNKSVTYAHVSRALLNILLSVTPQEVMAAKALPLPYIRVLGFRRESADLLAVMKEKAAAKGIPVLINLAKDLEPLSPQAAAILEKDLLAADLYNQLVLLQSGCSIANDYSHPVVIL